MSYKLSYSTIIKSHLSVFLALFVSVIFLSGCELSENHLKMDRAANLELQDFRDGLEERVSREEEERKNAAFEDDIPSLQSYIAQPSENLKPMPLVSISVNQTVPLRDALFELAQQASYSIELDPRISGSIIFTARDSPFDTVVRRISEIAGLRYTFDSDVLRVELDTPYNKSYKIDYLSYIRTNTSSINNDITVVSGSDGANTGSKFESSSESEADFWGELETNLSQLLGVRAGSGNLRTESDPQLVAVDQNPVPVDPVVVQGENGETIVQVQPPEATLQVTSLPTSTGTSSSGRDNDDEPVSSMAVNRQAGIVSVYATERQHEEVRNYMNLLRRSVTAQVLIEAKIMEVSLSDEFATGIDWNVVSQFGGELILGLNSAAGNGLGQGFGARPTFDPAISNPNTNFALGYVGNDITAVMDAVSRFGTVRALASPRLTVLNNQSAVLNVARNQVYFDLDIDITTTDNTIQTDIDSEIKNVPEGILINVLPSIDLDSRTVSMALRPTITRIDEFVDDPSVQFVTAANNIQGVQSRVPVVIVQEMDSVVRMNSGQALLMGGLMQDRTASTHQGVPILSEIPLFGSLFRNHNDKVSKTELVIFIKATIIDDGGNIHDLDRDLYRRFSGDRRPLRL